MRNSELEETQVGIKIAGRNINNLRYADDTTPMAASEEELKSLNENEGGDRKCWLKTQHSEPMAKSAVESTSAVSPSAQITVTERRSVWAG